jgi:transcription elongation factor GreA
MQKYPMTLAGEAKLKDELKRLKSTERPKIIEAIATARALGDLKENAEYHAAREQQSFIEGRILDLEGKLSNAQVIDITKIPNEGKVIFGSTVTITNMAGLESTYTIVGEDEVDLKLNKISYASPIGKALIGKMLDDQVTVQAPAGAVQYDITAVEYIA